MADYLLTYSQRQFYYLMLVNAYGYVLAAVCKYETSKLKDVTKQRRCNEVASCRPYKHLAKAILQCFAI